MSLLERYPLLDRQAIQHANLTTRIQAAAGARYKLPSFLLVGLRNTAGQPDQWCDLIGWWTPETFRLYQGSTRPGVAMLRNPVNPRGAAIVQAGYYPKVYTIGQHQNKADHRAFRQVAPFRIRRVPAGSNDWHQVAGVQSGVFGLNLHRANLNSVASVVGLHSSGCQVIQRAASLDECLAVAENIAPKISLFDYCLLEGLSL